jgi:hypothetical protein
MGGGVEGRVLVPEFIPELAELGVLGVEDG